MPLSPAAKSIRARIKSCMRCDLRAGCKSPVPWRGSVPSPIVIIGEAPGESEDQQGRPFVGKAGQLLDAILRECGVDLRGVAYVNAVCCRPPSNRDPLPHQIAACTVNLKLQLGILDPDVVVLAGRFALSLFRPAVQISKVHGRPFAIPRRKLGDRDRLVRLDVTGGSQSADRTPRFRIAFPIIHPAATFHRTESADAFNDDLSSLRAHLDRGWVDWPEDCEVCGKDVDRYDERGSAWCRWHYPVDVEGEQLAAF